MGYTYKVVNARGITVSRPNKVAAGMERTLARKPATMWHSDTANRLAYAGTCDLLHGLGLYITDGLCVCCGQRDPHKKRLNKHGQYRLHQLRQRAAVKT
jgi:hypothetical protein